MLKTFKYRLYPNKTQSRNLHQTCFLCSLVYNQFLAERRDAYQSEGKSLTAYDQIKTLPAKKQADPRLKQVYSQVLQDVARRADKAFQGFFRRVKNGEKPGYPRFKSARRYDRFTYPQSGFRLIGGRLKLSKIGSIKIKLHRPMEGKIKTLTIRRLNGKWYACFSVEVEAKPLSPTNAAVGLDVGLEKFAVTSHGETFSNPRHLRHLEKKLKRLQRTVSRRKKGSNRQRKAVRNLARAHERVANQRRDMAHKIARLLVNRYGLIAVEDLQIKNMVRNRHLAKSISDAGWGLFLDILAYKAAEAGRRVVKVDPRNTSQACSNCGAIVPKTLSQRRHNCPECGYKADRDVNAARNILQLALQAA